jgi:endoglucanase
MKKITLFIFLLISSMGFSQNLVTNGDFQTGVATPWTGNAANPVNLGGGDYVNQAQVIAAGNPWEANLSQNITLLNGKTYVLSFDAFTDATTGTRTMLAGLGQNNAPYSSLTANPALTATKQNFSYKFTINYGDAVGDRVLFDMGAQKGFVFIDNVSVTEFVDATPPTGFTATVGTIGAYDVELLLNATDDSGSVTYNISYNGGANTVQTTGTSGVQKSFKVPGLTKETAYTFNVSASDATGNTAANNPIPLNATTIADTSTACAGTSSDALQGSLSNGGYNYKFETLTNGDVQITFELLVAGAAGVVAYLWRNPDVGGFQELPMTVTGTTATKVITGLTSGQDISYAVKFAWAAGGFGVTKYFAYKVGDTCALSTNNFDLTSFKTYPNPTKDTWTVTTKNTNISSIQVYDVSGRNVLSLKPNAIEAKIDASSLKTGVYFARINTLNGYGSLKLIKE